MLASAVVGARSLSLEPVPATFAHLLDNIRLLSGAEVRLKDPLIELRFDGNLVNTGTLGGEATFVHERESNPTYNWVWQNRASLGEGLGGGESSGLDNTQVGGMGNYGQGDIREGGVFYQPGDGLHGLRSITLSGWFKTPAGIPWSQEAYMIGRTNGIDYYHQTGTGQRLILSVPYGQPAIVRREFSGPTATGITPWQQVTDQWVFHAATFDGTTGTASFYYAYEDSETVIHDVTRTGMDVADLRDLSLQIAFGNTYFGTRPFKGHLDNMRVFGSTEDGSGALSQAQLAYLWARDLTGEEPPSGLQVRIIAIDHDGSNFTISYETDIGVTYTIERSTDLVNWETIATVAGDGTNQVHSDPVAGADRQFYRIQAESTN